MMKGSVSGMRFAHLIESDGPGGAERVVAELAMALQAAGSQNVVFLPADGEGWLRKQIDGSGVETEFFRLDRPLSPSCAAHLTTLLRRRRIDLAHSHEFSMAVYGAWAARRAGIPHVITMHGGRYYAGRLRRRLAMRAAAGTSAATVAVSEQLARHLARDLWLAPSRITTVPNGVRPVAPGTPSLGQELRLEADAKLIVAIGNLYPVKGHVHLVEALALVANRHPRVHVAIGGRGDQAEPLLARASALGVLNRVHLLGLRSDLGAVLGSADIFALPSLSEGLPLALLEAMFARRAIVASDVGEIGIALGGGEAGLLVPPGDPRALADALLSLLSDPARARALGERAAERAFAEYDLGRMVSRYVDAYEAVRRRRSADRRAPYGIDEAAGLQQPRT